MNLLLTKLRTYEIKKGSTCSTQEHWERISPEAMNYLRAQIQHARSGILWWLHRYQEHGREGNTVKISIPL